MVYYYQVYLIDLYIQEIYSKSLLCLSDVQGRIPHIKVIERKNNIWIEVNPILQNTY